MNCLLNPLIAASLLLFLAPSIIAKTTFTGDIVDGIPVISTLDLTDVPANAITHYYFFAGEAQGTINYHIPVLVARGTNESVLVGRKLSLSSTVHGDEYSGVRVVQNVFARLETVVKAGLFNGSVIGIPTINVNGVMHNQRNFFSSFENGFLTNLNRVFPGKDPDNATLAAKNPEGYAFRIWKHLWGNTTNVDVAVDMHTLTTGSNGPMWVYADYRTAYIPRLAQLAEPDIIKIDPGEAGSIETAWVENSIPAITLELGPPSVWNGTFIRRGTEFVFRLMRDLGMTADGKAIVPDLSRTYVATNRVDVPTTQAGWAQSMVDVLEDVDEGQELVTVYDSWGRLVERVRAPSAGRVLQVRTNPAVEGGTIVVVLVNNGILTE